MRLSCPQKASKTEVNFFSPAVSITATRTAEQLGRRIVSNMVMVGLFTGATGLVTADAVREAVRTSVPRGTEKLNLDAFESGLELGMKLVAPRQLHEVHA